MKTTMLSKAFVLVGCLAILPMPGRVGAQNRFAVRELGPGEVTSEKLIEVLRPNRPVWNKRAVQMVTDERPCASRRTRGIELMAETAPVADVAALRIEFAFNSDELSSAATATLRELGKALRSNDLEGYCFQIEGHTDAIGSDAYNDALSQRRAESVVRHLSRQLGVDPNQLVTVGRGKSQPIASNDSESGRQRNRRVQIVNLGSRIGG
jgi:outer membrane protein OmpA-like peptidoglycan-associated protein